MGTWSGFPRDFVFQGSVVRQDEEYTTVRMFPGLDLDLRKADIAEIDEAADEVTERPYVRIKLKENAEVAANFTPRLARLALENEGVPFAYGGSSGDVSHALPSGLVNSILPHVDRHGLALFQRRMGEANWGGLAGGTIVMSATTYLTNPTDTDQDTPRMIQHDTLLNPNDPSEGKILDTETVTVKDPPIKDGTKDTKTGDW